MLGTSLGNVDDTTVGFEEGPKDDLGVVLGISLERDGTIDGCTLGRDDEVGSEEGTTLGTKVGLTLPIIDGEVGIWVG